MHFSVRDDTVEQLVFIMAEDKISKSLVLAGHSTKTGRKNSHFLQRIQTMGLAIGFQSLLYIPKDIRELIKRKGNP